MSSSAWNSRCYPLPLPVLLPQSRKSLQKEKARLLAKAGLFNTMGCIHREGFSSRPPRTVALNEPQVTVIPAVPLVRDPSVPKHLLIPFIRNRPPHLILNPYPKACSQGGVPWKRHSSLRRATPGVPPGGQRFTDVVEHRQALPVVRKATKPEGNVGVFLTLGEVGSTKPPFGGFPEKALTVPRREFQNCS